MSANPAADSQKKMRAIPHDSEEVAPDICHTRTTCRACGAPLGPPVLSLGLQPMANAFLRAPGDFAAERFFPLDLVYCDGCALVQVVNVIDPAVLFSHYLYVTGTSDTIAAHNKEYAATVAELLNLGASDLVVEVASNDGSLLTCFRDVGSRTLGIEPATNIAAIARERGIDTVNRFFDEAVAREIRREHGPARAVVANNVLAHVDEPRGFLQGCRELVDDEGLVVIEVPYATDMLQRVEYDTIYHEHLCYFAIGPLSRLAASAGLRVVRVDRVPVHGGSIRVFLRRGRGDAPEVVELIARESEVGVTERASWVRFASDAAANARALRSLLEYLARAGHSLAAYGAPAKGNTLLNYARVGTDLLPFTVDRNPLKVGLFTPGQHLPVLSVDSIATRKPDFLVLLAWNFADEIVAQQHAFRERGGRFVIPIPTPRVF